MDGTLMYPDTAATPIPRGAFAAISVNLVKARAVVITATCPCAQMLAGKRKGGVSPGVW